MATPITWRNVDVNPVGEISRAMSSGQAGINLGFESFANVLKQQQQVDDQNWNQQKSNNTNAFMNEMARYTTPEAYQAALDSGELQSRLTASGAQIDQAAARQAMGAQMGILQDRLTSGQKFQDGQTDRAEAPIIDQVASLNAQGRTKEAKTMLDQLTLRNEAKLYEGAAKAELQAVIQKRADTEYDEKRKLAAITGPEALRAAEETVQVGRLNRSIARAQQEHSQGMAKRHQEVGAIAADLKLPVDASGRARIADFTTENITQLNTALKAKGLSGYEDYLGGDTKARDEFRNGLIEQGVPAHIIKGLDLSGFNSGGLGLVGQDAAARDRAAAENEVGYEDEVEKNWFAPGNPNARKLYDALSDEVPKLIDKSTGVDPEEDVADLQSKVYEWSTKGINVPGTEEYVIPPVQLVRHALRTAQGGWFTDGKRTGSAESILEKALEGKNIPAELKASKEAEKYFNKQKVKDKLLNSK